MKNTRIVTEHLERLGLFPVAGAESEEDGLIISMEKNVLHILGAPHDLIELADYFVSLALSGKNIGQHWHIDQPYIINESSEVSEIVVCRNKEMAT